MTVKTGLLKPEDRNPAVHINYDGENHLFDCSKADVSQGFVNKLRNVYVSHTHMDHFNDFDSLLSMKLRSPSKNLRVFGPRGILESVQAKIKAYTWNLAEPSSIVLDIYTIDSGMLSRHRISVPEDIEGIPQKEERLDDMVIDETQKYRVRAIELDHGITSMGYSFEESEHLNINEERLARSRLAPGHWLEDLKDQIRKGDTSDVDVNGASHTYHQLAPLVDREPGKKIVYLTDFRLNGDLHRIAEFAQGADVLYCEANYSDADGDLAKQNFHLTTEQAAQIARAAGVKELVPFHFSRRYKTGVLLDETKKHFESVK